MKLFFSDHTAALIIIGEVFFAVHTVAFVNHVYHNVPLIDVPMHMLFGAWVALLLFHPRLVFRDKSLLFIFLAVLIAGVGWECIEYVYDHALMIPRGLPTAQHGILETLRDLLSNAIGASVIVLLFKMKFREPTSTLQQNI